MTKLYRNQTKSFQMFVGDYKKPGANFHHMTLDKQTTINEPPNSQNCNQREIIIIQKSIFRSLWTEGDHIIGMAAGERAGLVIISVAVGFRAGSLENLRVFGGRTRLRGAMALRAAVFRSLELLASAFTGNHLPIAVRNLELRRARFPKISDAPRRPAVPCAVRRPDSQGDVEAFHKAHIVEIRLAEGELCEGGRRHPGGAVALEATPAVARGTGARTRFIESATRAAPEAA